MAKASARAKRIYEAGVVAYNGTAPANADKMLKAIALMLDEATKKPARKAATKDSGATLPFGPGELYEAVKARVPHIIACEPYSAAWFGRLGKVLKDSKGLKREDMDLLVAWIEGGALDFGNSWSFSHVIKHFDNWIAQARNEGGAAQQTGRGAEDFME